MAKFKLKSGNSPLFKNMGSSPAKHTEDWSGFTLPEHEEPHKEIGQGMASYLRYQGMSGEQVDLVVDTFYENQGVPSARSTAKMEFADEEELAEREEFEGEELVIKT